jgi:hypothetical protein
MHRLMVEENMKRENEGQPPLTSLPKPCDCFDLIGGTSTRGRLLPYPIIMILKPRVYSYRIIAFMLGRRRMGADTATDAYNSLAHQVFSDQKRWPGAGRFKVTKLEEVIIFVVQDVTGDPEKPLLEVDNTSVCRT